MVGDPQHEQSNIDTDITEEATRKPARLGSRHQRHLRAVDRPTWDAQHQQRIAEAKYANTLQRVVDNTPVSEADEPCPHTDELAIRRAARKMHLALNGPTPMPAHELDMDAINRRREAAEARVMNEQREAALRKAGRITQLETTISRMETHLAELSAKPDTTPKELRVRGHRLAIKRLELEDAKDPGAKRIRDIENLTRRVQSQQAKILSLRGKGLERLKAQAEDELRHISQQLKKLNSEQPADEREGNVGGEAARISIPAPKKSKLDMLQDKTVDAHEQAEAARQKAMDAMDKGNPLAKMLIKKADSLTTIATGLATKLEKETARIQQAERFREEKAAIKAAKLSAPPVPAKQDAHAPKKPSALKQRMDRKAEADQVLSADAAHLVDDGNDSRWQDYLEERGGYNNHREF